MSDKLQRVERELSVAGEGALEKALADDLEVRVHECGCSWDIMDKGITITMRCAEHARREAALAEAPLRCNFWMLGERCGCLAGHEGSHGSPEGWAEVQRALETGSFAFRETLDDYARRKK